MCCPILWGIKLNLDVNIHQAYILRYQGDAGDQSDVTLTTIDLVYPLAFPELEVDLANLFWSK